MEDLVPEIPGEVLLKEADSLESVSGPGTRNSFVLVWTKL